MGSLALLPEPPSAGDTGEPLNLSETWLLEYEAELITHDLCSLWGKLPWSWKHEIYFPFPQPGGISESWLNGL